MKHELPGRRKLRQTVIEALREVGHDVKAIADGRSSSGVILLRFPSNARRAKAATVVAAVEALGSRLQNAFTVVEPGRVRINIRD